MMTDIGGVPDVQREPAAPAGVRAAELLVRQLRIHGVDHVFCVPGESYLAVLDAMIGSGIEITVCRQEGGAAMMAEAHGKLTGRPAACFVTRGPGAANAMPGLHIAQHDSTPLLLFVGQVERGVRGRGAFQELDYPATFGAVAKWVVEIDDASRIPELISRAMHVAVSGRPGPVVISLPEDMLLDHVSAGDAKPARAIDAHPGPGQIGEALALLERAERPVAVLGGSRWTPEAVTAFTALAEAWRLPVAVSLRRQMLFPGTSDCFIGDLGFGMNPELAARVGSADLLLLIGARMSEVPSNNYTLLSIPAPKQAIVHVHPDPGELGRVFRPELPICATPAAFVKALTPASLARSSAREGFLGDARQQYLAWSDPADIVTPGALQMGEVMRWLAARLPADTIMCNGAGNFATWIHRFYRFREFGTQLAPTSGSMGYGVPAAVGAKRVHPDRMVIAFAGDGDFLMNGQEFATAVQYDLPIIVILVDNGLYGTIRMHQEREYPGRPVATSLRNPDFAAYARAFGGHGETVTETARFGPAFERAVQSGLPAIVHCRIDPEAITPSMSLSEIRAAAIERMGSNNIRVS